MYGRIRLNGINSRYVFRQSRLYGHPLKPSAFVAHRRRDTRDLYSAVSSIAVGDNAFEGDTREERRLRRAIRGSDTIVLECNLASSTMHRVHCLARVQRTPKKVLVAGVSESKILHHCGLGLGEAEWADVLIANEQEVPSGLLPN